MRRRVVGVILKLKRGFFNGMSFAGGAAVSEKERKGLNNRGGGMLDRGGEAGALMVVEGTQTDAEGAMGKVIEERVQSGSLRIHGKLGSQVLTGQRDTTHDL